MLMKILRAFSGLELNPQDISPQDNTDHYNSFVEIQIQKGVDQWRTVDSTINDQVAISHRLMECAEMNPDYRVRAIDQNGNILDMIV